MKKRSQLFAASMALVSVLWGCSEKPTPKKETHTKVPAASEGSATTEETTPQKPKPAPEPAAIPTADEADVEREVLLAYFNHLAEGRLEEAKGLEMRTQKDCQALMLQDRCEAMLKGQNELHDQLMLDPVPRNSKLIDFAAGQKQKVGPDKGFLEGTTLWLGSTIRARGPGGNEFLMRSLGLLVRGEHKKIIWGKRRTFGDTPRNPASTPQ